MTPLLYSSLNSALRTERMVLALTLVAACWTGACTSGPSGQTSDKDGALKLWSRYWTVAGPYLGGSPLYRVYLPGETVPKCDCNFTWRDYFGSGRREEASYYINGRPTGKGKAGFEQLVTELRAMPKGSLVLVHPRYGLDQTRYTGRSGNVYPFVNYWRLLGAVGEERSLTFVFAGEPEDASALPHEVGD